MKLVILLSVVVLVKTLSRNCEEYCKLSLTSRLPLPGNPQCNCFPNEPIVDGPAKVLKLYKNGIYYEPAELYPVGSISPFDQPFYILNPIANVHSKPKKQLIDANINIAPEGLGSKLTRKSETIKRKKKGNTHLKKHKSNKVRPYWDIEFSEQAAIARSKDKSHEVVEELHQIELNLSECLDLHKLALSRKHNNLSELLRSWEPIKFQRLSNLSDDVLSKAIQNTCNDISKYFEKSLNEIIDNMSKRKPYSNTTNIVKENLLIINDTQPLMPLLDTSKLTNNSVLYSKSSSQEDKKPIDTEFKKEITTEKIVRYSFSPKNTSLVLEETDKAQLKEDSNITLFKGSTNIKNDTPSQLYFFQQNYPTSLDTTLTIQKNTPKSRNLDKTNFDDYINKNEVKVITSKMLQSTNKNNITNSSYKIGIDFKKEPISIRSNEDYNSNDRSINKESKEVTSQFRDGNIYHQITLKYLLHNNSVVPNSSTNNHIFLTTTSKPLNQENDGTVSIVYARRRQKYNESEVQPQRIITKEFSNNSLVSLINGTEDLPNYEFINYIDEHTVTRTSNLSNEIENVSSDKKNEPEKMFLIKPRKQTMKKDTTNNVVKIKTNPVITGSMYFLFGNDYIPAKFVQKSDGKIHVGIDGATLCQKLSNGQNQHHSMLAALCN